MATVGNVEITGLKELQQELKALPKHIALDMTKEGLIKAGLILRDDARRRTPVRSGNLRKSIQLRRKMRYRGKELLGVQVRSRRSKAFPGGYYAHLVEKGHKLYRTTRWRKIFIKHVPANPFMRPALEQGKGRAIDAAVQEVKKGIAKYKMGDAR